MKVIFDLALRQILIEGDGPELIKVLQTARDIAPSLPNIQIATRGAAVPAPPINNHGEAIVPSQATQAIGTTMRQFVRGLSLDNAAERIAAIAYYTKTHEGRDSFSPKEMDVWFGQCGLQKPSQMGVAIFDTKRKYGYIDNGNGRGQWRIAIGGENLVIGKLNQAESAQGQES
jgi:hypothetical protein